MKYNLKALMVAVTVVCMLLGLWVAYPRDKFYYQQDVKVTGGFYQGQVGTITEDKWFCRYSVNIGEKKGYGSKIEVISQFDLAADSGTAEE